MQLNFVLALLPLITFITTISAHPVGYDRTNAIMRRDIFGARHHDISGLRSESKEDFYARGIFDMFRKNPKVEVTSFKCDGCSPGTKCPVKKQAIKHAEKQWRQDRQLQNYKKVEVTVKSEIGRHHVIEKYHNGALAGPTYHHYIPYW
ncbi:hypothetical protein B0H34DRAFT_475974 [Crassisporium funariophilum]|nr:hypothetical protein B0H34DRAFT_475974 [Crassisporium funariophilum]